LFKVEGNDIVKKKAPASQHDGGVEMDLTSISKAKQLSNGTDSSHKAETIPIRTSSLKSYSSAWENNTKNKETGECYVNFGYDTTGNEQYTTVDSPGVQKHEKDSKDSNNEKQRGETQSKKHTKASDRDGKVNGDNST
jgi:hypothetical protein